MKRRLRDEFILCKDRELGEDMHDSKTRYWGFEGDGGTGCWRKCLNFANRGLETGYLRLPAKDITVGSSN